MLPIKAVNCILTATTPLPPLATRRSATLLAAASMCAAAGCRCAWVQLVHSGS